LYERESWMGADEPREKMREKTDRGGLTHSSQWQREKEEEEEEEEKDKKKKHNPAIC
jgi:hypothetical protein